jgi:excisionase family DNA binding protein
MNTPNPAPLPLLTRKQAAKLLTISVRKLDSLVAANRIRCVRIDRSVRFTDADLNSFVAASTLGK